MYIFEKSFEIAASVVANIEGRAADQGASLPYLISMAIAAGPGDHCEIGSLWGASAVAVAFAKKEWGFPGTVYCIDPYLPREGTVSANPNSNIPPGTLSGSPEGLANNAVKFGVEDRIVLLQSKSQPWPGPVANSRFVSAYIDGDHVGQMPWYDFLELSKRTDHYIALDNFEEAYPAVMNAGLRAMNTGDWTCFYKNASFLALRKNDPSPNRFDGNREQI
jgi:hypothetical protein